MVTIQDPSILEKRATDEYYHPSPQKTYADGRSIYVTETEFPVEECSTGVIQIIDYDLSVWGDQSDGGYVQAGTYRAPEVILGAGYSYSSDIWSLGVMVC